MKLYDWQEPLCQRIVDSLRKHRVFVSAYPTGSGKTVLALEAIKRLEGPWLVVAPKVSLTAWKRTAEKLGVANNLIGIINPEKISHPNGCDFYKRERVGKRVGKDGKWFLPVGTSVVWDEPHRTASGEDSAAAYALAKLKAYAKYVHLMTATLADTPRKLRAVGWLCGLHQWHDNSFYRWCRENGCHMVDRHVGGGITRRVLEFTKDKAQAEKYMAGVRKQFGPRYDAINPESIPGFPSQTLDVTLLDLSSRDTWAVNDAAKEMSERLRSKAKSDLARLNRERERIEFHMAETLAEVSATKIADGISTVNFFCFTEPRERFETKLRELGVERICRIYGGQKDSDRQADIDAFQRNEVHAASVQFKAGGAAVSLHDELKARPRESFIIPAYEAADIKQALGRIRRCEGTHATQHFVLAAGTLQERVAEVLERKLSVIDTLNDSDLIVES